MIIQYYGGKWKMTKLYIFYTKILHHKRYEILIKFLWWLSSSVSCKTFCELREWFDGGNYVES